MGHKRRGSAIIINNKDFHPTTGSYPDSDESVQAIFLFRLEYTRWNEPRCHAIGRHLSWPRLRHGSAPQSNSAADLDDCRARCIAELTGFSHRSLSVSPSGKTRPLPMRLLHLCFALPWRRTGYHLRIGSTAKHQPFDRTIQTLSEHIARQTEDIHLSSQCVRQSRTSLTLSSCIGMPWSKGDDIASKTPHEGQQRSREHRLAHPIRSRFPPCLLHHAR